jgi:hypothetical protein
MSTFTPEPPYRGKIHKGCLNCSTAPAAADDGIALAPLDMTIAVGFGSADVTCDGDVVYDEQEVESGKLDDWWTVRDAEAAARLKPDADWRITKHGPLHGETYQRQGEDRWVLIESNEGFA